MNKTKSVMWWQIKWGEGWWGLFLIMLWTIRKDAEMISKRFQEGARIKIWKKSFQEHRRAHLISCSNYTSHVVNGNLLWLNIGGQGEPYMKWSQKRMKGLAHVEPSTAWWRQLTLTSRIKKILREWPNLT